MTGSDKQYKQSDSVAEKKGNEAQNELIVKGQSEKTVVEESKDAELHKSDLDSNVSDVNAKSDEICFQNKQNESDTESPSTDTAIVKSIDDKTELCPNEDDSTNNDTDVNMDSLESDTGDSQDSGEIVKQMLDSMVKNVKLSIMETATSVISAEGPKVDNTESKDSTAVNPNDNQNVNLKETEPEFTESEMEVYDKDADCDDEKQLSKESDDGKIVQSTERAYEVLAMWDKISNSTDAGSEVLCDLIAQKIKEGKKQPIPTDNTSTTERVQTEAIKRTEIPSTINECVQTESDNISSAQANVIPERIEESVQTDLPKDNTSESIPTVSDQNTTVNIGTIEQVAVKHSTKPDQTEELCKLSTAQDENNITDVSVKQNTVPQTVNTEAEIQSANKSVIKPSTPEEMRFYHSNLNRPVVQPSVVPEEKDVSDKMVTAQFTSTQNQSQVDIKEIPDKQEKIVPSIDLAAESSQNVENPVILPSTNKENENEQKLIDGNKTSQETTKVARTISTSDKTQDKSANIPSVSVPKQPLVIDLDAPSSTETTRKQVEKTPVKQSRVAGTGQKPSPRAAVSPSTAKSPQTPGKQSFIDNLIATGVPIVIPDDDDDDEGEANMPKARSNIFKMKSQQYNQPSKSLKTHQMGQPTMYNDPSGYSPTQSMPYQQGQTVQRRNVGLTQTTEGYSNTQNPYQEGAYIQPPTSNPMRKLLQQTAVISTKQSPMVGTSPQRRAIPEQMTSPLPSPSHTFTSPQSQNRRVSFSPTSNVYPINPNTPPRVMPQQGYVTPTKSPAIPVMSPRMRAASPGQMAHVRRNIGSPQQTKPFIRPQAARSQGPIVVIDDDPPPRPPQPVATPKHHPPQMAPKHQPPQASSIHHPPQASPKHQSLQAPSTHAALPAKPATVIHTDKVIFRNIDRQMSPVLQTVSNIQTAPPAVHVLQTDPGLQTVQALQLPLELQAPPVLPIITNVTSMAKDADVKFPDLPDIPQMTPLPQAAAITERKTSQSESLPGSFVQQTNERTPVKRSRSSDSLIPEENPQEEPMSKRRNITESMTLPVTVSTESLPEDTAGSADVPGDDQTHSNPDMISPSKLPPEVVIDIDVDDKSLVRRQLNIEAGQITSTTPLHSPSGSVSSQEGEGTTSGTSASSKRGRPRGTANKTPTCDECGKSFSTKAALTSHFKTHSADKPFECDVCGKHFLNKGNLKKHIYTHFKEKQDK